ncbi:MAG: ABC transporter ATP-binding protein [Eubacteriales bacterium]|nr:ABC transporter ATP-binding protein [Eubacteriales bacterium]
MAEILMSIEHIYKTFSVKQGAFQKLSFHAVNDVSLHITQGKVYGLVGESGCGKSTLASTILQLTQPTSGRILYRGMEVDAHTPAAMKAMRKDLQLIFQDPFASIDPKMKIRDVVMEPMRTHKIYKTRQECYQRACELMEICGMSAADLERYPHEFSGGQRQRISIARVLGMDPKLIIADESTAALDVSVQAQILNLFKQLQKDFDLTMIFISHDLNVIKHISDRIIVMYMGSVIELADKEYAYHEPKHPYTQALISAVPNPDPFQEKKRIILSGELPRFSNLPTGCPFHPRCPQCMDICRREKPALRNLRKGQKVACHLYDGHTY